MAAKSYLVILRSQDGTEFFFKNTGDATNLNLSVVRDVKEAMLLTSDMATSLYAGILSKEGTARIVYRDIIPSQKLTLLMVEVVRDGDLLMAHTVRSNEIFSYNLAD